MGLQWGPGLLCLFIIIAFSTEKIAAFPWSGVKLCGIVQAGGLEQKMTSLRDGFSKVAVPPFSRTLFRHLKCKRNGFLQSAQRNMEFNFALRLGISLISSFRHPEKTLIIIAQGRICVGVNGAPPPSRFFHCSYIVCFIFVITVNLNHYNQTFY